MNKDNAGETPLHNASRHGHLGLVEVLLEVGVDVGAQNAEEETPLHITSGRGNLEIFSFSHQIRSRRELLRQSRLDSSPRSGTEWPP